MFNSTYTTAGISGGPISASNASLSTTSFNEGGYNPYSGYTDGSLASSCLSAFKSGYANQPTCTNFTTYTFYKTEGIESTGGAYTSTETYGDGYVDIWTGHSYFYTPTKTEITGSYVLTDIAICSGQLFSPSSPCCGQCTVQVQNGAQGQLNDPHGVQLIYWPTPAPSGQESVIVNSRGFTFVSPSPYVIFPSIYAFDLCSDRLGRQEGLTYTTMAFGQHELSTYDEPGEETRSFNFQDLTTCSSYFSGGPLDCRPQIALPTRLRDIDPLWSTCELDYFGGYDPPYVLSRVAAMAPVMTPSPIPVITSQPGPQPVTQPAPGMSAPSVPGPTPVKPPHPPNNPRPGGNDPPSSGPGEENSDAGGEHSDPVGGHSDPSEGHSNPSGGHSDPSGGHSDPSGGHSDPSGGHSDPSGGHSDPSEGHSGPGEIQNSPDDPGSHQGLPEPGIAQGWGPPESGPVNGQQGSNHPEHLPEGSPAVPAPGSEWSGPSGGDPPIQQGGSSQDPSGASGSGEPHDSGNQGQRPNGFDPAGGTGATNGFIAFVANQPIAASDVASGSIVLTGSQGLTTLHAGDPTVIIAGTPVALGYLDLVVGTSTYAVPPLTTGGTLYSEDASIEGGAGSGAGNGELKSADADADFSNAILSAFHAMLDPLTAPKITVGNEILTAKGLPNGDVILSDVSTSFTITKGASATVISGTPIALDALDGGGSELLKVGDSTATITLPPSATAFNPQQEVDGQDKTSVAIGSQVFGILPENISGKEDVVLTDSQGHRYTLYPGGAAVTISGEVISLDSMGDLIVRGSTTLQSLLPATDQAVTSLINPSPTAVDDTKGNGAKENSGGHLDVHMYWYLGSASVMIMYVF